MRDGPTIQTVKRIGTGLSLIAFPLMLLVGFLMHPNLLDFNRVIDVTAWSAEFRGNFMFHFGHLLVLLAVPLIIVAGLGCMRLTTGGGAWLGLIGRAQAAVIIVGLLLLLNPDIEIISVAAASLMCLGYIPLGIQELRGKSSDVAVGREGK